MKFLFTALCLISTAAFAGSVTDKDVLRSIDADPIGHAALEQTRTNDECTTKVTKLPEEEYGNYEVLIICESHDEEGGIYLAITIKGQYWDKDMGDVQSIEIGRAG